MWNTFILRLSNIAQINITDKTCSGTYYAVILTFIYILATSGNAQQTNIIIILHI